jgi:hypothetical protein
MIVLFGGLPGGDVGGYDEEENVMADDHKNDFYRPMAGRELRYSTAELERRKVLTEAIVRNLKEIRAEGAHLEQLEGRIERVAADLRLLRELDQGLLRFPDEAA